ncbi:MAG: tRNA-intron lyase [Candidatus Methanomethylicota archaeon]|uniref:tRNA-intron lyase n=1 Tax=Thermoproteota archaeon TaxID=2056631 RepID=A0A497ES69_9CREN|nr:MAG: tRNA-intron lyase [Candidatus Verstraetearchaeota archaeon]
MSQDIFKGKLKETKVIVEGVDAIKLWNYGYYGEFRNGILELSAFEALYLVNRGKLKVFNDCNEELNFSSLLNFFLKIDHNIWIKYLIYSDLRKRGYIVKPGFGTKISFRVYRRGAEIGKEPAKYLVYGIVEGKPIELSELSEMVKEARSTRKELILAIVDRQGEVTYYDVTCVRL